MVLPSIMIQELAAIYSTTWTSALRQISTSQQKKDWTFVSTETIELLPSYNTPKSNPPQSCPVKTFDQDFLLIVTKITNDKPIYIPHFESEVDIEKHVHHRSFMRFPDPWILHVQPQEHDAKGKYVLYVPAYPLC